MKSMQTDKIICWKNFIIFLKYILNTFVDVWY